MKIESIWQHRGLQWFGKWAAAMSVIWRFNNLPIKGKENMGSSNHIFTILWAVLLIGAMCLVFRKVYRDKKAYLSVLDNPQELCVRIDGCRLERKDLRDHTRIYEIYYNYEIDQKVYMFCTRIGVAGKEINSVEYMIASGMQIKFVYNQDAPEKYFCKKPMEIEKFDGILTGWSEEKKGQGWYIFTFVLFLSTLITEFS